MLLQKKRKNLISTTAGSSPCFTVLKTEFPLCKGRNMHSYQHVLAFVSLFCYFQGTAETHWGRKAFVTKEMASDKKHKWDCAVYKHEHKNTYTPSHNESLNQDWSRTQSASLPVKGSWASWNIMRSLLCLVQIFLAKEYIGTKPWHKKSPTGWGQWPI